MKVLVVDDVGYARHYHTRLLQKFGYQAESVETGQEALSLLERDASISVVLTDLVMREMDGVDLFKQSLTLKRPVGDEASEPPAFILMTAVRPGQDNAPQKENERIRMAKDLGFIDVLYKPIDPEHLRNTLATIRYARTRGPIDTSGTVKRVAEIVDRLISEKQLDDAGRFLDDLRDELQRLDEYVSQLAEF